MFSEVIARHVLNRPIIWSEELGRMIFIWCVFLGGALAFLKKQHITIDYFTNLIPPKLTGLVSIVIDFLVMATMIFVFVLGTKFAADNFDTPAYSIPFVNLGWAYVAVPLGAITMVVNILRNIFSKKVIGSHE
jgi:TRAP-type C4-dicarboxylate transport system permease small subunit